MQDIFDSHAHYDDEHFDGERENVLQKVFSSGVRAIINAGTNISSSIQSQQLAHTYPGIYFAAGVHPSDASLTESDYLDKLRQLSKDEKCVAIGEIGLDYHYDFSPQSTQLQVFEQQLELANQLQKPVIIHNRQATEDTMRLLNKYHPAGVVHCFSSSAEIARQSVKLGLYIGITGMVTFKNAKKVIQVIEETPLQRLLLETDCPYMAPEPMRGRRCDSSFLTYTAQKIAEIKQIAVEQLIQATFENTCRLFGISTQNI